MSSYTLKFYKGRKLIAERTWDANESFVDDITHEAEQMIEEAIQCNPPDAEPKVYHSRCLHVGGGSERAERDALSKGFRLCSERRA